MLSALVLLAIIGSSASTTPVKVSVDPYSVIASSGESIVSFNFDYHKNSEETPLWINCSVMVLDLTDAGLLAVAKSLAPGHLRIGGSEGDKIVYNVKGHECEDAQTDPAFCLNMDRWAEIVKFSDTTGVRLVYALNGMTRKDNTSPLNLTNHDEFLGHIAAAGQNVWGFELGNELPRIAPEIMANDFLELRKLINKHWPSPANRPKLIGCDLNCNAGYMEPFLKIVGSNLDVVTYHNYVDSGTDKDLPNKIATVEYLDAGPKRAAGVIATAIKEVPHAEIWAGEIAAAWHSGRDGVTNRFYSSFWYADALGALSVRNHTGMCRQTLVGGAYGLLNRTNFEPNPDYFVAKLWRQLMGARVLKVTPDKDAATLRVYAHCSAEEEQDHGAVVVFINVNNVTTFDASALKGVGHVTPRYEYQLTAKELGSYVIDLNGIPLEVVTPGSLPSMPARHVTDASTPLLLPPYSVTFVRFVSEVHACH